MQHEEMVSLIRAGVPATTGTWADLGAGTGNFTAALRDLLPADAIIYALDRDRHAIAAQQSRWASTPLGPTVIPQVIDITKKFVLPPLDGLLLANVLHFIRNQGAILQDIIKNLRPGGRLLVVEYDLATPRSYVPFPISIPQFPSLAGNAGLSSPQIIGTRRSPSSGIVMYAASAILSEVGQDRLER